MRHLSSRGTNLLIPASKNSVPCSFDHIITAVFTLSSLVNMWPEWWSLRVGEKWKSLVTRSALYGGCSGIVHWKWCKNCCVAFSTWGWALLCRSKTPVMSIPGHCCLMAAYNCFRVAGCTIWCCIDCWGPFPWNPPTVNPCSPKTPWPAVYQQICLSWISSIAGTWDVSTPCLHVFFRGSDDEPTSHLQ